MNSSIKSVGIIGLGSFGRLAAAVLLKNTDLKILGFDPNKAATVAGLTKASLEKVAKADVIILAIPLSVYRKILSQIKHLISPETLIVDVCSVKTSPEQLIDELLPTHPNLLLAHPLFGPQSAHSNTRGHELIVTGHRGLKADKVLAFAKDKLGLKIEMMTAAQHDKIMAEVHALTFFVARGLNDMNLRKVPFMTPSFQMLLDLVDLDRSHSQELFDTIQHGNPFAESAREDLISSLNKLQKQLNNSASLKGIKL